MIGKIPKTGNVKKNENSPSWTNCTVYAQMYGGGVKFWATTTETQVLILSCNSSGLSMHSKKHTLSIRLLSYSGENLRIWTWKGQKMLFDLLIFQTSDTNKHRHPDSDYKLLISTYLPIVLSIMPYILLVSITA